MYVKVLEHVLLLAEGSGKDWRVVCKLDLLEPRLVVHVTG